MKKLFLFLLIFYLVSCNESNKEKIDLKETTASKTIALNDSIAKEKPPKLSEVIAKFKILNNSHNFKYIEEIPDSFQELSINEAKMLNLAIDLNKDAFDYTKWYILGKSESKNYFSLFVCQTIEGISIFQVNYSNKDSSLIQKFLLSDWTNPCEESSSTETKKIGKTYIQTIENEYQEWSEDKGFQYYETIITNFIIKENGKIDSLSSHKKIIKKEIKE
jgi:hypothetical protein